VPKLPETKNAHKGEVQAEPEKIESKGEIQKPK